MLNKFARPRPNATMIKFLKPVNDVLCLKGVPLLRDIPVLNRMIGFRGICDVRHIDFPKTDRKKKVVIKTLIPCQVPKNLGFNKDKRCLAFRIYNSRNVDIENLYTAIYKEYYNSSSREREYQRWRLSSVQNQCIVLRWFPLQGLFD